MKALTEKKLIELSEFVSNNRFIEDCDKELITAKIREIIACESNDIKLGKFDVYDLTDEKEGKVRPFCASVHHLNGYRYVTDTRILLKLKSDYPAEMEGKSIKKDGSELNIERLPNFESVLKSWIKEYDKWQDYTINFDRVKECVKLAKAHKKIHKKNAVCVLKLGDVYVDTFRFEKFCSVISYFGINTIKIGAYTDIIGVKNEEFELILMPMKPIEEPSDNEQILTL